jgi:hypothetical protein
MLSQLVINSAELYQASEEGERGMLDSSLSPFFALEPIAF